MARPPKGVTRHGRQAGTRCPCRGGRRPRCWRRARLTPAQTRSGSPQASAAVGVAPTCRCDAGHSAQTARTTTSAGRYAPPKRPPPRRGATRLPCPLLSLHQCSTRRHSPHLSHRLILSLRSQMTRTGRLTTSRHPRRGPSPPLRLPERRARSKLRRTLPTTPRPPAPPLLAPQHPFPNPTHTDGFPTRKPGPVALPRASGERTEQERRGHSATTPNTSE